MPPAFVDRHGTTQVLDPTLRDRLKPAWRSMLQVEEPGTIPSDESIAQRVRGAASAVREARALVAAIGGRAISGRVLEVGCFDGAVSFELARDPAVEAVASDLVRYYVVQVAGRIEPGAEGRQMARLAELRERTRLASSASPGAVEFIEDDLTASRLAPASFGAILSFEVLEHVDDPGAAFSAMARLLVPGGIGYHVYNPFFSMIGGHSLCTLDFPWGHARLDGDDVERYLEEIRPAEREQALRFYRQSLNRMTLAQLRRHVAEADLELLALITWADRQGAPQLTFGALAETQRVYPTATPEDLLSPFVTLIVRRPGDDVRRVAAARGSTGMEVEP